MRQGGGSGCSTVDDGEGNEPDGGKAPTGTAQVQTQSWRPLHRHLVRVNDAAHRSRQTRFTALFHHVDASGPAPSRPRSPMVGAFPPSGSL